MSESTLYERLGEHDGIRAVVDEFYDRLLADEDIGPLFEGADMELLRQTQTDFLCEAAGGPETYDAEPIREAHLDVPLTPELLERAIAELEASLDTFDVPAEDAEAVVQAVAEYETDLLASPDGDD